MIPIIKSAIPQIPPLPDGIDRPFWSVMIPTCNPENYLERTLESILVQAHDSAEMQIEVVDDCSTKSDVDEMVRRIAGSKVSVFRQPARQGLCGNWNACIERARGKWIHILHQDDIVLPGFYQKLKEGIEREPGIGAAFCRHILMDEDDHWYFIFDLQSRKSGVIPDWLERIASRQLIQTPAIVVRREAYERLGGFHPELVYTLDWEMWKRVSAHYPVWYEPQPLACYRTHKSSETLRLGRIGADITDVRKSIEISRDYLPDSIVDKVSRTASENFALYAVQNARSMLQHSDVSAALAQIRGALGCQPSWKVIKAVVGFFAWAAVCFLRYSPQKVMSLFRRAILKYRRMVEN